MSYNFDWPTTAPMMELSVVAVINGQTYNIEPSEVSLKVVNDNCEISIAGVHCSLNGRLIFKLKISTGDNGIFHFKLASHDFNCLALHYFDTEFNELISNFVQSVHKLQLSVPCLVPPSSPSFSPDCGNDTLNREYNRIIQNQTETWRVSNINGDFQVCPTYPGSFIVPSSISDSVLRHASKFRSRARLPILSYLHNDGTSIFRSSQALVGLQRNRSVQDERLISAIRNASPKKELLIVDARPTKSAMANAVSGAGFMLLDYYENCQRVYLGIENIHSVRTSYLKVFDFMMDSCPPRSAKIEAGWVRHYETIIEGVRIILEHVKLGISVLVHCSDGWDRTAQLVSLAQICLDPYCRTIDGFIALIEREWVAAGHQFELRLARRLSLNSLKIHSKAHALSRALNNVTRNAEDEGSQNICDEFCPIFPQFLDCLLQFIRVYPNAFEFGSKLINDLWGESYLTMTDTFKGNCEFDRSNFANRKSFWKLIRDNSKSYGNPNYNPVGEDIEISKDLLFYL